MERGSQNFVSASIDETQSEQVALLLKQLNSYERAPKGLTKSWMDTQQAEEDSTARIFLDEGTFPAWFAYFLTKKAAENRCHFSGKASYSRLIGDLENESATARRSLAARLTAAIQPEVAEKIDKMRNKRIKPLQNGRMSKQPKRSRRVVCSLSPHHLADTASAGATDGAGPPPVILSSTAPRIGTSGYPLFSHHSPQERMSVYSSVHSSDRFAEDEHVLVNASLAEATRLFPRGLCNAVRRNLDPRNENALVAAISMTFPNAPFTDKFGCQMALEVTEDKVQHLAWELFEVRLETRAGLRYVCLAEGGSKILPNPKFTIQGCQRHIISSTFGPEMSHAITTSPLYQDDARQWRDYTDCVSMVISHQAHDAAVIFVSLGLWEGTRIKKKLYG